MKNPSRSVANLGFLVLLLGLTLLAKSQTYPEYRDLFVNDYADLLSTPEEAQLQAQLQFLKAETGKEIMVFTLVSFHDYTGANSNIEGFATGLFNSRRAGNAPLQDGVLLLISLHDRELRVQLGKGYTDQDDRVASMVIAEYLVPAFQQGEYSRGIVRATEVLSYKLGEIISSNTSAAGASGKW